MLRVKAALVCGAIVVAIVAGYFAMVAPHRSHSAGAADQPVVNVEALTPLQARGRLAFNTGCAGCHGRDALGGDGGPPLVHKIYEPSHHGDGAFYRAVQAGVPQHHWNFGNMPPQPNMTQTQVAAVIEYVRAAQRQNGIN